MKSSHSCLRRRSLAAVSTLVIVTTLIGTTGPAGATPTGVTCTTHTVPVALASGLPKTSVISGKLCARPADLVNGSTIQVLAHGGTYDHTYWDFGTFNGIDYDYAGQMAAHGFPTFSVDLLGNGASSRPLSTLVTINALAYTVHQVVQAVRGTPGATITPATPAFGKVILVGHSMGSLAAWREAIDYGDVDGLVITGMAHNVSLSLVTTLGTAFYPAPLDPKFFLKVLDPGYLTTFPGNRGSSLYNVADADPAVIAHDEVTKEIFSAAVLSGFVPNITNETTAIDVPVLSVMGTNDFLCGPNVLGGNFSCASGAALATQEAPAYAPGTDVQGGAVPSSGHDVSLHLNAGVQTQAVTAWAKTMIGQRGVFTPTSLPAACGA